MPHRKATKTRIMCEILEQKVKRSHFPTTVFTKIRFLNNSLNNIGSTAVGAAKDYVDRKRCAGPRLQDLIGEMRTGECTLEAKCNFEFLAIFIPMGEKKC